MKNSAVCFFKMRGGSTIAEAAVIFPIIILSIVTAIYLLISLYSQTAASAALHHALLDEAADESGTSLYEMLSMDGRENPANMKISRFIAISEVQIEKKNGIGRKAIMGKISDQARAEGLLQRWFFRKYEEEIKVIDEEEYIRCVDIAGGILKKEVQ